MNINLLIKYKRIMKKIRQILGIGLLLVGILIIAADHIDAPSVTGTTSDITDYYAFQGNNQDNIVFMVNVQGLLAPDATANASFDENVMLEFNIDTNGDAVEDLVIQAVRKNKKMYFLGPFEPSQTGTVSTLDANIGKGGQNSVFITPYGSEPNIGTSKNGMKFFAGPRDDPFFFDFARYSAIISGQATGFDADTASDTFAGTNVLSVVVEVPKSMFGGSESINTWVESKRKQ